MHLQIGLIGISAFLLTSRIAFHTVISGDFIPGAARVELIFSPVGRAVGSGDGAFAAITVGRA